MLCFSGSLIWRGSYCLQKRFCSVLRITHFSFQISSSSAAASLLSESERLVRINFVPYSRNFSKDSSFSCLRFDRTMAAQSSPPQSVHDFTVKDGKGNDVDLSIYKGKVLLIVNVASKCGLTDSNYTELTQIHEKYKNEGLQILAFPCNQFGSEEPGTNEEIQQFACTRFKAEYPIFDKVEVNGENAAPIFKFLKSSKGGLFGESIKWNFSKFLVDKQGHVVDRYAPTTSPQSIEKDIKKLLGKA